MLKPIVPESLYEYSIIEDPQFSPDGKRIAFVRQYADDASNGYIRNIWIADPSGRKKPYQFTFGGKDFCPRWSPDGHRIAFVSVRNGTPQIYVMSVDGGEAVRLTSMVGGASGIAWSPDGKWIAFNSDATEAERELEDKGLLYNPAFSGENKEWSSRQREALKDPREITRLPYRTGTAFFDGCYHHVYIIASTGGTPKRLSHGDWHHSAPVWSADSKSVLANSKREQSSGEENFELWSDVIRFDIETAAETVMVCEVAEEGTPVEISPDGKWIMHTFVPKIACPYQDPYHVGISAYEADAQPASISHEDLTIAAHHWAADSEHIYCVQHHWGKASLIRMSRELKDVETVISGDFMVESFNVDKTGRCIAYTASSSDKPSDLYVMDLTKNVSRKLTDFNREFERTHFFSIPKEIRYKSTDDVEIQGWYMYPRDYDPSKSYPLAVEIHGGPQIMWGTSFWHEFQILASHGCFVFFCNPRGSAGYGANFQRIRYGGGYTDMPDIMNGLDTVLSMEKSADPERLAVTGGSYGGFLTAWVVTHTDRFKAAVSQRGVYDQFVHFGCGDIPEAIEWYYHGKPRPENLAELWDYSPSAHAANVTTPTLILHSELDYRCPISMAESFFAHMRRNGVRNCHMLRFPGEGHELSRAGKPHHRIERLARIVGWFDKFIRHDGNAVKEIERKELRGWLRDMPGWKVERGTLTRVIECGDFDLAVKMLNKTAAVLEEYHKTAKLAVDNDRLVINLVSREIGKITLNEVLTAKRIDERVIKNK